VNDVMPPMSLCWARCWLLVRSGAAQALVTGDKDLLALRDRYAIVTPAEFWARHGGL
jgi:predicted nucleic acid-binding protein